MTEERYRAQDLIDFGRRALEELGFPQGQAQAAARVLVEADLRGDPAHGLAGAVGLLDFIDKNSDDPDELGFKRLEIADYSIDPPRYEAIISVDAGGTLGHYVAWEMVPLLVEKARRYGYAKVYIRNSTHFGDCGIFSEMIAEHDLAGKVTCTAPAWTKPFIELQDPDDLAAPANLSRYQGVKKRLGTNPIAWSIPYEGGVITLDMAASQRAMSPVVAVARHNSQVAGVASDETGALWLTVQGERRKLSEVHLQIAISASKEEALARLGLPPEADLRAAEKGLLRGPQNEEINFPLAFDGFLKKECYLAPLGGTFYGYKGFGLNLLIELDNVLGGGVPGLIRVISPQGKPTTPERVSHTMEAHVLDAVYPLAQAKGRLKESVETTLACGNDLLYLPGQKEQEQRARCLAQGVPLSPQRLAMLQMVADHPRIQIPFDLKPIA